MKLHRLVLLFSALISTGTGQTLFFSINEPDDIVEIMPEEEKSDPVCNDIYTTFDLSRTGIRSIRDNNFKNPLIKCLNLEGNNISTLSFEMFGSEHLANLQYLNLSNNNFSDVIQLDFLNNHENLKTLVLDENVNYDFLFHSSFILPNLKNLYLRKCNLVGDIELNDLTKYFPILRKLYLSDNDIETVSYTMATYFELEYLYLDGNNRLKVEDVFKINHVTHLFFGGKSDYESISLNSVPCSVHILSLKNMSLTVLENLENDYKLTNLTTLDLSHNKLSSSSLNRNDLFPSLLNLSLSHNFLSEIPKIIESEILEVLSLSYNQISHVSSRAFENNLNLKILSLRGNQIKYIEENSFSPLIYLRILDLAKNQLSVLPTNWMSNFYNLRYLNVNFNNIQTFEALKLNNNNSVLEYLHWRNNKKSLNH